MLKVGQKLWYVSRLRGSFEVTIEKVGRKWAYIGDRDRIDIETLIADGGNYMPPGQCYLSRDDYDESQKLYRAWSAFVAEFRGWYHPPHGMTVEKIEKVKELLGLKK